MSAKLDSQWPNGIIPDQFSQKFKDSENCIIKKHMMEINQQTCVKIVPRTSEEHYEHYVLVKKEAAQVLLDSTQNTIQVV